MANTWMNYCLDVGAGSFPRGNVALDISHVYMRGMTEHYVIGDACHLPFRDSCFSKLESHGAINYFMSDKKFLEEVVRVVKPRALVIISSYSYYGFFNYLFKKIKQDPIGVLRIVFNTLRGRYRWYTVGGLKRTISQRGLEVIKTHANLSLFWRPTSTPHNILIVATKKI